MQRSPRKPTLVRRREIATAALSVIGENGAAALTTATLAAAVGLTPGALFRHFANLEEVLDAAVDHALEGVEATFPSAELPPRERLEALARRRAALLAGDPGVRWLLLSDEVFLFVPERAVLRLRELVQRSRSFVLAALTEGAADGSLRADLRPELLLPIFTGTLHALVRARGVHAAASEPTTTPTPDEGITALLALLLPPTTNSAQGTS